jgi:hypothetical protein
MQIVISHSQASSLRNILRRLQALTSDAELFVALSQLTEWQLPKADLFHFIPVLNRIDKLLNSIILKHFVSCKMEINDEQIVSSSPAAGSTSTQFISAGRVDADPLSSTKSNQKSRESADELEENVEIDLSRLQQTPFAAETKFGILAILNFTRLLLENSTNRSIYNSYEVFN